ncbi:MAG: ABC transporter permease [Actinomycetota bacterium]|nr:ABC transporter permease [Actinomycetota bacterium]
MNRVLRTQWAPLLAATIVAGIVLSLATKQFGSSFNVYTILQTAAVYTVIGLSQMMVLAVADMSLAVGGIASLVTIATGNLYQVQHWPIGAAIAGSLALGLACGLVNGAIIATTKLSGFIVTLATGTAFTGIAYGITSSIPYSNIASVLTNLGQGRAAFFSYLLLPAIAMTLAVGAGFRWLPIGRSLLAVGGNKDAAVLSGLSEKRAIVTAHAVSGVLAAVAAVLYIGVLQSATPATGSDWLIISFAVPIIGGTALVGGEAPASGCFVAAIVLSAINDALIVLNVNTEAVQMAEGLLIFAAVIAGKLGQSVRGGTRRSVGRPSTGPGRLGQIAQDAATPGLGMP